MLIFINPTLFSLSLGQKIGAPGGTRTHDPLLRRQMLYPAELPEHVLQIGNQFNNLPRKRQKINPLSNKNSVLPRISHTNNRGRNHYHAGAARWLGECGTSPYTGCCGQGRHAETARKPETIRDPCIISEVEALVSTKGRRDS